MDVERWMRVLAAIRPEPVVVAAVAVTTVLIVAAFVASLSGGAVRSASIACVAAFVLLNAIGVSLYAWRLGEPGRSD